MDAGFEAYFSKPVRIPQLLSELKKHLKYTPVFKVERPEKEAFGVQDSGVTIKNPDELKSSIESITLELKKIEGAIEISAIEDINSKIIELGERHCCSELKEYANTLSISIEKFDIVEISDKLAAFPNLIKKIINQ